MIVLLIIWHIITNGLADYSADTGFKHVEPAQYEARLLHFHGDKKSVTLKEVPLCKSSIDSSDVFILDLGLEVYQVRINCCGDLGPFILEIFVVYC